MMTSRPLMLQMRWTFTHSVRTLKTVICQIYAAMHTQLLTPCRAGPETKIQSFNPTDKSLKPVSCLPGDCRPPGSAYMHYIAMLDNLHILCMGKTVHWMHCTMLPIAAELYKRPLDLPVLPGCIKHPNGHKLPQLTPYAHHQIQAAYTLAQSVQCL